MSTGRNLDNDLNGLESIQAPRIPVRKLFAHPPLLIGFLLFLGLILIVLFGPNWGTYDPYLVAQSTRPYYDAERKELVSPPFEPSSDFPLGSDQWGNDLLSLLLYGARMTIVAGFYIMLTRIFLGVLLGSIAGWFEGGSFDRTILSVSAVVSSVPILLSSLIIIYALNIQNGLWVFMFALSIVGWTETMQIVRSEMLRIRKMKYIEAARSIGLTQAQIIVKHVFPNIAPYLLVIAALEMSAVLLLLAELGFLGTYIGGTSLYIPDIFSSQVFHLAEVPEWGALVAQSVPYIRSYPFIVLGPALAFFISIVTFNALGEGLRWMFDRWPVSMALLLRKRILLVLAVFVGISVYVISFTGSKSSFVRVSKSFDLANVQAHVDALSSMDADEVDQYIEDVYKDLDVSRGWKPHGFISAYHFSDDQKLATFKATPELNLYKSTGQVQESFIFGHDFKVMENKAVGSGNVTGQIVVIRHTYVDEESLLDEQDLNGKVVIAYARTISPQFPSRVAERGAQGLLAIMDPGESLSEQNMLIVPAADEENPNPRIPVFQITAETADRILYDAGLTVEIFWLDGWHTKLLDTQVNLKLDIEQPESLQIHNTIGFMGGYDANLAQEMVVLFTSYDSRVSSPENFYGVGTMLEIARIWRENKVDPRRAVLFVAWDNAHLGSPGASVFIGNPENFKNLTGLASRVPVPVMVWQFDMPVSSDDGIIWIDSSSDEKLAKMIDQASAAVNAPVRMKNNPRQITVTPPLESVLSLPLPGLALVQDDFSNAPGISMDSAIVKSYGESLSYALLNIMRKPKY